MTPEEAYHEAYTFGYSEEADIKYLAKYIIKDQAYINKFIKEFPQHLELLRNEPGWEKYITQEMINKFVIENIIQ